MPSIEENEYIDNLRKKYGTLNYKRPTLENIQYARSFIRSAEMDSKASAILFKEGIFALSVFHIQQSVEKLCKAYLLTYGVVDMEYLKKEIGHNSPLIFTKMVEIMFDFIPIIKQASPEMNTDIAGISNLVIDVNKSLRNKNELPQIVKPTYNNIIDAFEKFDTFLTITFSDGIPALKLVMNLLLRPSRIDDWDKSDPEIDGLVNSSIEKVSNNFSLIILAILTFPHEQCTRYPDMKPCPDDYTSDFGIVRSIPIILERIGKVQTSLFDYINMFDRS